MTDSTDWQKQPFLPRDSPLKALTLSPVANLGMPAAVLMQLANGAIAAAISDTGRMQDNPSRRVRNTMILRLARSVGSEGEARDAARYINAAHRGIPRAGNHALQEWVDSTVLYSSFAAKARYGRPMTAVALDRAYQESARGVHLLGLPPRRRPADLAQLKTHVEIKAGRLRVTPAALELSELVLNPPVKALRPFVPLLRHVASELLPEPLAEQYGLEKGSHPNWDRYIKPGGILVDQLAATNFYGHLVSAFVTRALPAVIEQKSLA